MKRMVKNGDLIDVEPDGTITVAGKPIGGGGSDYTAGSNIEISESKEIAVKSDLTGINSLKFPPDQNDGSVIITGRASGVLSIKSNSQCSSYPEIDLLENSSKTGKGIFHFLLDSSKETTMKFDTRGSVGELYPVIARGSKIPFAPSTAGNYVLKATVSSGGSVTYSWVAE